MPRLSPPSGRWCANHPALAALDPGHRRELAAAVPGVGDPAADAPVAQVRVFEALLALLDVLSEEDPCCS